MKYNYCDKEYDIPEQYIEQQMKANKCSREEACELWLCDNDIDVDPDQAALIEDTKDVKIGALVGAAAGKEKKKRKYTKKENQDKKDIINILVAALNSAGYDGIDIINDEREVNFVGPDGNPYRFTLAFRRNDSKAAK